MRKQILLVVAACLLVLPTQANDLTEQLCADEVFTSMIEEAKQVVKHVESLTGSQREAYLASVEFACFRETFLQGQKYLSETYNLFERPDREAVITQAIKKVAKQEDPRYCETYYALLWQGCFTIINPYDQAQCFAAAQAWYNRCMGYGGVD